MYAVPPRILKCSPNTFNRKRGVLSAGFTAAVTNREGLSYKGFPAPLLRAPQ